MSEAIYPFTAPFRAAVTVAKVGEMNFPTSLDASRRVLRAVENPDIGLAALAKIVVAEPLLSAKVIRLANSVALNPSSQPVRDVRQAVVRVGMEPIKALAMVLIMNQLRQAQKHGACRKYSDRLWERSIHVAAVSFVLAKKISSLNADEAMFAGIVHDLGRFYLLARAVEFPEMLDDHHVLAETVNDLAPKANKLVLEELVLPPTIIEAVVDSESFCGHIPVDALSDILYIATRVTPRPDPLRELDTRQSGKNVPEEIRGLNQETLTEIITASGEEIYSIILALES